MFERFTDRARRAVVMAQEEARLANSATIDTDHILLALLEPKAYPGQGDGVAYQALHELGFELTVARDKFHELRGAQEGSPGGHIPFTHSAKKILELALREALQLGHNYIGTEHLLLAICRVPATAAADLLLALSPTNGDPGVIRTHMIAVLSGAQAPLAEDILARRHRQIQRSELALVQHAHGEVLRALGAVPEQDPCWRLLQQLIDGTVAQLTHVELAKLRQRITHLTEAGLAPEHLLAQFYRQVATSETISVSPPPPEAEPAAV